MFRPRFAAVFVAVVFVSALFAQNEPVDSQSAALESTFVNTDSLPKCVRDSMLIEDLTLQVQELKLNEILIRSEYDKSIRQSIEADSIKKAVQKRQIDSLRNHMKGEPLVIEGDTLFSIYAKRGGVTPVDRIERAQSAILKLGKSLKVKVDTLYILDSDYVTDIMSGDKVIITLTDHDGLWQNVSRQELAELYLPLISNKILELHAKHGLLVKVKRGVFFLLVVAAQLGLIYLTNRLFRKLRRQIVKLVQTKLRPISIKDYEFLDTGKQGRILLFSSHIGRLLVIAIQLLISIPILFSIFPETENFAYILFSYLWNPFKEILVGIVKYIPNLFKILILCLCFRYLNRGLKYVAREIDAGKLKITGFYNDWAFPTYYILRFLLYSFMFIMIWPLLPNSDSSVFQGVSVFVGLVISLGSTTVIGNLMAGMVLTYMRSFKIGDQIKMGDVVGVVIEKTPFVIRIRTSKNEVITIPNSTIMSSQTVNYSISADTDGIIVHTEISVGYEIEKQRVMKLLVEAASESRGIEASPKPFVMVTKLEDFYCYYQINAYTKEAKGLPKIYSDLHERIVDKFNEAGIELMSPHFYAQRDGNDTMIPPRYKK